MSVILERGFERDRLDGPVRWWFYAHVDGDDGRRQASRLGVADQGFRFARGGYARTDEEAGRELEAAEREAQSDLERWRGQPSHALGGRGQLVPLDRVGIPA